MQAGGENNNYDNCPSDDEICWYVDDEWQTINRYTRPKYMARMSNRELESVIAENNARFAELPPNKKSKRDLEDTIHSLEKNIDSQSSYINSLEAEIADLEYRLALAEKKTDPGEAYIENTLNENVFLRADLEEAETKNDRLVQLLNVAVELLD